MWVIEKDRAARRSVTARQGRGAEDPPCSGNKMPAAAVGAAAAGASGPAPKGQAKRPDTDVASGRCIGMRPFCHDRISSARRRCQGGHHHGGGRIRRSFRRCLAGFQIKISQKLADRPAGRSAVFNARHVGAVYSEIFGHFRLGPAELGTNSAHVCFVCHAQDSA
jgi:hypothetical protein